MNFWPIGDAIKRQIDHFDNLIRHAQVLGFEDDVAHWESEKAAYIAEMSEPDHLNGDRNA